MTIRKWCKLYREMQPFVVQSDFDRNMAEVNRLCDKWDLSIRTFNGLLYILRSK